MPSDTQLANEGIKAIAARDYKGGIEKLTEALKSSRAPLWLLERSKAHVRIDEVDLALQDAENALRVAFDRANRDYMIEAQLRRAITLFRIGRYADADICAHWATRLIEKAKATEDDGQQNKVDANGDYAETSEQVKDANKVDKSEGLAAAMKGRLKSVSLRNQALSWRLQALTQMEKLPAGHTGRKVTVTEKYPKYLESSTTSKSKNETPADSDSEDDNPNPKKDTSASAGAVQNADTDSSSSSFYQTNATINADFFVKNIPADRFSLEAGDQKVLMGPLPNKYPESIQLHPWGKIKPSETKYTVKSMKIELILQKETPGKWPTLQRSDSSLTQASNPTVKATPTLKTDSAKPSGNAPVYPTSSKKGAVNWDKFTDDDEEEEEETKEEGDVGSFFQKLYKDADADTRRAMMKSYLESNGTSLSTSWAEAKDKTYSTSPPDGAEAKKWEE
ncbi:hypothetical protein M426DRAFT_63527 [Hypoxylon sp. CI-4A]|nr:hypothetical protein M426DRAFT_63527 [Hypoxylon sp. CI-4A]